MKGQSGLIGDDVSAIEVVRDVLTEMAQVGWVNASPAFYRGVRYRLEPFWWHSDQEPMLSSLYCAVAYIEGLEEMSSDDPERESYHEEARSLLWEELRGRGGLTLEEELEEAAELEEAYRRLGTGLDDVPFPVALPFPEGRR